MHRRIDLFVALMAASRSPRPPARRPRARPTWRRVWPWFNLTAACANHDACLPPSRPKRTATWPPENDRYAHCATRPWDQRGLCRSTANVLYDAVRRFGHLFYG